MLSCKLRHLNYKGALVTLPNTSCSSHRSEWHHRPGSLLSWLWVCLWVRQATASWENFWGMLLVLRLNWLNTMLLETFGSISWISKVTQWLNTLRHKSYTHRPIWITHNPHVHDHHTHTHTSICQYLRDQGKEEGFGTLQLSSLWTLAFTACSKGPVFCSHDSRTHDSEGDCLLWLDLFWTQMITWILFKMKSHLWFYNHNTAKRSHVVNMLLILFFRLRNL